VEKIDAKAPGLTLSGEARSNGLVVKLAGELDLAGADLMNRLGEWLKAQPNHTPLILDLSGMTFVDSSGIRMLLDTTADGRKVALFSPTPPVARVLELTGLRERFEEIEGLDGPSLDRLRDAP
jgi:anti-sigma B factor antagonist